MRCGYHRKRYIKDHQDKMRVLLENLMFKITRNEVNLRKNNHLQSLELLLKNFDRKQHPTHPLTWKRKVWQRLRTKVNEQNNW
jgi:hypothetical protein